jgi:pimeloyl-ACP methyl ester carboxylesterase
MRHVPTYRADDGTDLAYDVHGDGEPLIVLAGGAALHPDYLGNLSGLSEVRQLVVPHLRGVGRSPAPTDPEFGSFWRQAADVDALRRHLGVEKVHLAGHSAGARLAVAYAAQHPERIDRLLLITPPPAWLVDEPSDTGPLIDARRGEPAFDAALVAREQELPDDLDEEGFNAWQQAVAPVAYARWDDELATHARSGWWSFAAAKSYFSVAPPEDVADRLRAVAAPVLVVGGAQDCTTGVQPVIAVAGLFPAGRAVVLEGCAHFPWLEQPCVFRCAVDEFLSS